MSISYIAAKDGKICQLTRVQLLILVDQGLNLNFISEKVEYFNSGVSAGIKKETRVSISDGINYIWGYGRDGVFTGFEQWGLNRVEGIIEKMSQILNVELISEHDVRYRYLV